MFNLVMIDSIGRLRPMSHRAPIDWSLRARPGTCYFAPNICSSLPSADDLHVVLQLDVRARRERDRRRGGGPPMRQSF
jgi:hypothetical protein